MSKEKEVEKFKCLNTLKTLERNDLHIYEGEEINTFIQNGYFTLIKSDSKAHFYKRFLFSILNKCCSFELSIQRILFINIL